MATPWIKSHTGTKRNRKVIALSHDLRLKPVYVLGHLHALWHETIEQCEDGDLSCLTDKTIAEFAGFNGDGTKFVSLLQKHAFLDKKMVHDWLDYAGSFLIARYKTSNPTRLVEIWRKHGKTYGTS